MKQTIRIIGGQYRGKKLQFPDIEGLRPTPDRVRETLFNWLMHSIRDARCLDAFAGSGALGFEAFSRGAGKVVLVEHAMTAYTNLHNIASSFKSPHLTVIKTDALLYIQNVREQFDIVFLDPPFSQSHLLECIALLADSPVLVEGGLLYIESPIEIELDTTVWEPIKAKKAGHVFYALHKKRTLDK